MNSDPQTAVPAQQNPGLPSNTLNENAPGWRELILKHDVESIWHRLTGFVQPQRSAESDSELNMADKTQEVFLYLLTEQRFNTYVDGNWSDEQISREILLLMQR